MIFTSQRNKQWDLSQAETLWSTLVNLFIELLCLGFAARAPRNSPDFTTKRNNTTLKFTITTLPGSNRWNRIATSVAARAHWVMALSYTYNTQVASKTHDHRTLELQL